MVTINDIPVYNALIDDPDTGMLKISLVDDPAVMSNFQSFDASKKMLLYKVEDEEKRLVRGVVMRADFPIYRYDKKAGEYYIIYKADQIRIMAEKYLVENRQNNVNLMHEDGSDVDGVQMVQYFIKDTSAGVAPEGFDDIADGSLFAEFHVVNDDVWAAIKDGTYKGFSLEGVFNLVPEEDKDSVEDIVNTLGGAFSRLHKFLKSTDQMSKMKGILTLLTKYLAKFGNTTTDKGILVWDGEEDLKAGDAVYILDEGGNRVDAADGDYTTEDGKVIKVASGVVTEIVDGSAQTGDEFGSKATDKGTLEWNGNEDLKAGDEVFVTNEDGERVAAPDGDYKTEDGKVIKVVDGKVSEIVDDEAEVAEDEVKARREHFAKVVALMSESYDDKRARISEALKAAGYHGWIAEAGDDFVVLECWDDLTSNYKYYQFQIVVTDTAVTIGAYQEVKRGFIPVSAPAGAPEPGNPANDATEQENAALKAANAAKDAEITSLKREIAQLKKTPAAVSAHVAFTAEGGINPTGNKGKDKLASYFAKM